MLVKVTVIVESNDNELISVCPPWLINTKRLDGPVTSGLWKYVTRDKLAAAKRKLRVFDVLSIRERSKGMVFLETTGINRRSKPRDAFNKALKWFETNCAKLKLTQMCLLMCTTTRDIKIYIQAEKYYVEAD